MLKTLGKLLGFTYDGEAEQRLSPIQQKLEYLLSDFNLETDSYIRNKVESNSDRWIDIIDILNLEDFKRNDATDTEIIHCAENSRNLEADNQNNRIRSKKPFSSDPNRINRTIRVSGLNLDATADLQRNFFDSIFSSVENVFLQNKLEDHHLVYTGVTIVELGSEAEAKEAEEKGIEYGDGVLKVERMSQIANRLKQKTPKKSPRKA